MCSLVGIDQGSVQGVTKHLKHRSDDCHPGRHNLGTKELARTELTRFSPARREGSVGTLPSKFQSLSSKGSSGYLGKEIGGAWEDVLWLTFGKGARAAFLCQKPES